MSKLQSPLHLVITKEHAYKIFYLLKEHYPEAKMILQWGNHFELLVAIILSAQCTDLMVNKVTAKLFPKYRQQHMMRMDYEADMQKMRISSENRGSIDKELASATNISQKNRTIEAVELVNFARVPTAELEQDIRSTGFYHNKAKNVQAAARMIIDTYHGVLPKTIAELIIIPGVGRKTANVFLGNAYGMYEGIAVDTHVTKQSQLLGLTKNTNPDKIEQDLMKLFDQKDWFTLTYLLIEHGRNMRRKKNDRLLCQKPHCMLCTNGVR